MIIKYNASGIQQWVAYYDGPVSGNDVTTAVTVDNVTGEVYVTGGSDGGLPTLIDYATVKLSSNGIQMWVSRYNYNNAIDVPSSVFF